MKREENRRILFADKVLALMLTAVLAFNLNACGNGRAEENSSERNSGEEILSYPENTDHPAESAAPGEPKESAAPGEPKESVAPGGPKESVAPEEPKESVAPGGPKESAAPGEPKENASLEGKATDLQVAIYDYFTGTADFIIEDALIQPGSGERCRIGFSHPGGYYYSYQVELYDEGGSLACVAGMAATDNGVTEINYEEQGSCSYRYDGNRLTITLNLDEGIAFDMVESYTLSYYGADGASKETVYAAGQVSYTAPANFAYEEDGNGGIRILGFIGDVEMPVTVIPRKIDGKPVTEVGRLHLHESEEWIEEPELCCSEDSVRVIVPEGVKIVGDDAFSGLPLLEEVVLQEGLTTIGFGALASPNLRTVNLPDSVTEIGESAFAGCERLGTIIIPGGVKSIAAHMFSYSAVEKVILSEGVERIEKWAFSESDVKSVVLPDSLQSIGYAGFSWCDELEEITLPPNLTEIGDEAFMRCEKLPDLVIPEGVTVIGAETFGGCGFQSITLPAGLTEIGGGAFQYSDLKSIVIPDGVKEIGDYAFYNCGYLSKVEVPDSVTSIGNGAFSTCESLRNITLPRSARLGSDVFDFTPVTVSYK